MTLRLVGHRGAKGLEPENTLRGFQRAENEGAAEVELDLRLTADGALVVFHDATVDRTTDGSGPLGRMTLAEVRTLDAGLGERVPLFDEVLDATSIPLQVEIKEPQVVPVVADVIRQRRCGDRISNLTSFSPRVLDPLTAERPGVRRALILRDAPADAVAAANAVGADDVCVGLRELSAEIVAEYRRQGARICAWPANDVDQLAQAVAVGADTATSDFPNLAASLADS